MAAHGLEQLGRVDGFLELGLVETAKGEGHRHGDERRGHDPKGERNQHHRPQLGARGAEGDGPPRYQPQWSPPELTVA